LAIPLPVEYLLEDQVGTTGTLVDVGSDFTVYNPFGTAVAGNVYILCKRVDGVWIVDAEDCS